MPLRLGERGRGIRGRERERERQRERERIALFKDVQKVTVYNSYKHNRMKATVH